MLLFVGNTVISERRLISINFIGNEIAVNYDSGGVLDVEGGMCSRFETINLTLENEEEVQRIKRQFYKACKDGMNVFYFG